MGIERKILEWFAYGETGSSSKAMAFALAGIAGADRSHPADPADFNRCLLFLEAVPEAREAMDIFARMSPTWEALVERWEEVESTFLDECGRDWCKARSAPLTYALMKEIGC